MTIRGDLPPHPRPASPGGSADRKVDELGFALPEPARLSPARAFALFGIALVVLAAAFLLGWLPRKRAQAALEAETRGSDTAPLRVQLAPIKVAASDRSLELPGSVHPLEETVLYPRVTGYVRNWHFDIGERVKEGAALAEIDTPELDQQLAQARAQLTQAEAGLVQAQANREYAQQNLKRYELLAPEGITSKQELDKQKAQTAVDEANVSVAHANVAAHRADVQRLEQMKSFARIVAPFAGLVAARSVERGTLVTAGNATPLFRVVATHVVRVFLDVPQDVAPSVRVGVPVAVKVREYGGRVFEGQVAHAAGALDPATRTMRTEVRVANPQNELLAGMYAQAALTLPVPHRVVELPATALLSDAAGLRVAVVDPASKVHLVPVSLERDTGATVLVASGLEGTERVIRLASAELTEGRVVEVVP